MGVGDLERLEREGDAHPRPLGAWGEVEERDLESVVREIYAERDNWQQADLGV